MILNSKKLYQRPCANAICPYVLFNFPDKYVVFSVVFLYSQQLISGHLCPVRHILLYSGIICNDLQNLTNLHLFNLFRCIYNWHRTI